LLAGSSDSFRGVFRHPPDERAAQPPAPAHNARLLWTCGFGSGHLAEEADASHPPVSARMPVVGGGNDTLGFCRPKMAPCATSSLSFDADVSSDHSRRLCGGSRMASRRRYGQGETAIRRTIPRKTS